MSTLRLTPLDQPLELVPPDSTGTVTEAATEAVNEAVTEAVTEAVGEAATNAAANANVGANAGANANATVNEVGAAMEGIELTAEQIASDLFAQGSLREMVANTNPNQQQ